MSGYVTATSTNHGDKLIYELLEEIHGQSIEEKTGQRE